jgi:hypothetical protein
MNGPNLCFARRTGAALLALVLGIASSSAHAADPRVRAVRVPDDGIHPQAQVDARGRVHLIYFKGDPLHGDIYYVRSDDGGATFETPPLRVNSLPESAVITGTIRGPHVALGKGDRPHVAWMGSDKAKTKVAGKTVVPMLYTRLNDAGDTFEPQRNVIHSHPGLDGGGSVAADREGNVYVAWHAPEHKAAGGGDGDVHSPTTKAAKNQGDGKAKEKGHGHGHGHDEADRQVWVARSLDDGETFKPEVTAIPKRTGVCGCCGLNIHATEDGRVFVVFRSATEKVNRDIHVLASKDFGKTFEIASVDPWEVGTCVMSTAAFARRGEDVLAAWETKDRVRLAVLGDEESVGRPTSMPRGEKNQKHPSVAVNGRGEYLVVWTEGTGWGKGGALKWQVFDAAGKPLAGGMGRADDVPVWGVPAAVAGPGGTFTVIY